MSDLYIMFDETYDAPLKERATRLQAIAVHFRTRLTDIEDAYFDFLDSDEFYLARGL